jgi:hypothetical protein
MAGIGGCRSSGAITADKIVFTGRGKLISIHGLATGTDEAHIKLYDNTAASGTLIGVLYIGGSKATLSAESDCHGVIFSTGLYADVTHVSGTGATFIVEFN